MSPISSSVQYPRRANFLSRFRRNKDGVTAVEFGIVAFPFLLFVCGIIAVGLQFLTINNLDKAVENATRRIKVGSAQRNGMTLQEFKDHVCEMGGYYIQKNCNDVYLHIQSASDWADITPVACASNGQMTNQANMTTEVKDSAGGAEQVVLVTVCYDWQLPLNFPYLNYMLMRPSDGVALQSGGALIQSVATFRTEPYE